MSSSASDGATRGPARSASSDSDTSAEGAANRGMGAEDIRETRGRQQIHEALASKPKVCGSRPLCGTTARLTRALIEAGIVEAVVARLPAEGAATVRRARDKDDPRHVTMPKRCRRGEEDTHLPRGRNL